jgi:hypothetical protein
VTGTPHRGPLRLAPPSVVADETLAARLADLARESRPTATPVARRRWPLPVAGAAVVLATAGATFGADQARHHDAPAPAVVPAEHLEPAEHPSRSVTPAEADSTPTRSALSSPTRRPGSRDDDGTRGPVDAATTPHVRPSGRAEHSDDAGDDTHADATDDSEPDGDSSGPGNDGSSDGEDPDGSTSTGVVGSPDGSHDGSDTGEHSG